jgi:hypothetical protein
MSALTQILEDMLAETKAKGRANRKLKSGLHIEMFNTPASVRLLLWRDTAAPSISEWDTVVRHFPYNMPKVTPEPDNTGGRFGIRGTLPRSSQLSFG